MPRTSRTGPPFHRAAASTTFVVGRTVVGVAVVGLGLAACASTPASSPTSGAISSGGASAPHPAGPTGAGSAQSPAPVETNPPGDIPDSQAFVPFDGRNFRVTVPEGWAKSARAATVTFTDKYNSVTVTTSAAATMPSVRSVRTTELPSIAAATPGYRAGPVTTVTRRSGPVVQARYQALSATNPVTGKTARLDVERYAFWRAGRQVDVTVAAPVGADNVDPWRVITDSFTWR